MRLLGSIDFVHIWDGIDCIYKPFLLFGIKKKSVTANTINVRVRKLRIEGEIVFHDFDYILVVTSLTNISSISKWSLQTPIYAPSMTPLNTNTNANLNSYQKVNFSHSKFSNLDILSSIHPLSILIPASIFCPIAAV